MTTAAAHWCHIDRAGGRARSVCSCGWEGNWVRSAPRAAEHGLAHTATERNLR